MFSPWRISLQISCKNFMDAFLRSLALDQVPKDGPEHGHHQAGIRHTDEDADDQIRYKKVTPYRERPF